MRKNDLLHLADRTVDELADANFHSAAAVMRALTDHIRGERDDSDFDARLAAGLKRLKARGLL